MFVFKSNVLEVPTGVAMIAANSTKFSVGDPVYAASGYLTTTTTSSKILGYCLEDITVASDNQTVAKYCPQYVYAEDVEMEIDTDQAAAQTDVGLYAVLASATSGAQTLDLAGSATAGQFYILGINPDNTSKVTVVAVRLAKTSFTAA